MSEVNLWEYYDVDGSEQYEEDDFSQCCFCEHTYLSYCCAECPCRDEPMPEYPLECAYCKSKRLSEGEKK